MKKQDYHKVKYDPSNGTRNEWIDAINDEIDNIQLRETDILADEFELPEAYTLKLGKIFDKLKEALREQIQGFTIDTEMVFNQDGLMMDCLEDVYFDRKNVGESEIKKMVEIVNDNGYNTIEALSLAEQIKLDDFLSEMRENPYQLQLIA